MAQEYKIVFQTSREYLEDRVNEYMQRGWVPIGSVVIDNNGSYRLWCQSMVRNTDESS